MRGKNTEHRTQKKFNCIFEETGITLLLVVVIVSAILAVSIGIFNLSIGELLISGDIADSFRALNAADWGLERILFMDRDGGTSEELADRYCENETGSAPCNLQRSADGCYEVTVYKTNAQTECNVGGLTINTCIKIAGQFQCGAEGGRIVKRGLDVVY